MSATDTPEPQAQHGPQVSTNVLEVDEATAAFLEEKVRQYHAGDLTLSEPMSAEEWQRLWPDRKATLRT